MHKLNRTDDCGLESIFRSESTSAWSRRSFVADQGFLGVAGEAGGVVYRFFFAASVGAVELAQEVGRQVGYVLAPLVQRRDHDG